MEFVKGKYSKKKLQESRLDGFDDDELKTILQDLIARASKGDEMSLAEKDFTHRVVMTSYNKETNERMNIDEFPSLADFVFKGIYILYHNDLEGKFAIHDIYGIVPIERKKKEVEKLDEFFSEWREIVKKSNHKEKLLNEVAAEARIELKSLKGFIDDGLIDYREVNQKEKSIVLHSKYLYLTVKEFFEENEGHPIIAVYNGSEIEIDTHSLTHIMFRHYAGSVKQFDTNKSFHFDTGLDPKAIPHNLKIILERISSSGVLKNEPQQYIAFRHRGNPYAIWIKEAEKPVKGKQVKFNRLQTYYPILDEEEIKKIEQERVEIRIDHDLSVFRKK